MKRFAICGVVLIAGIVTAVTVGHFVAGEQPIIHASAQWRDVYRTPGGLVAGADLVVVARHLTAEAGRVVGDGEDATPFTNNTFAVEEVLKGEHNGAELVVEQTGGLLSTGTVLDINDGGPYQAGLLYLLFLKEGDGIYYLINHQARYLIDRGILVGVDPTDRVVAQIHGWSSDDIREGIRQRARILR